uniref:Uncharacterized protein n=1 Tax=viral metagenome TaxID=1070528 RepID=A0A6M3KP03_9ZZZZ
MRGLMIVKADHEMMERAITAGINTLIVPFYTVPGRPWDGYMDTWEENVATCAIFKDRARILACPVMLPHWCILPPEQQFIYKGVKLPGHFCPTNQEAYEAVIGPFRDLVTKGIVHEVILDVEHYSGPPKFFSEKIPCETEFCRQLGWEGQWKHRKIMMAADTFITGQLAIDSKWSVQCLTRKRVLAEGTYPKTGMIMRLQLKGTKVWNSIDTIVPGAFIEVFRSTDDFIKYLGYLQSSCPYSGYWIYSQMALTRNAALSDSAQADHAKGFGSYDNRRIDERDPGFFTKLTSLNGV